MTKQITLEEVLELVTFKQSQNGTWLVQEVKGNVWGDVCNSVIGNVYGDVNGDVCGDVKGTVHGAIDNREWDFIETRREKLQRLIAEGAVKTELLKAVNELEDY